MSDKVVQIVTERILAALESGTKPWEKPWAGGLYIARNLKTRSRYSGINMLNLWVTADEKGYQSEYWLTPKQAKDMGGTIRKGETGTPVIWAAPYQDLVCRDCGHEFKGNRTEDVCRKCKSSDLQIAEGGFAWRYYKVFNLEQIDGIDYPKPQPRHITSTAERVAKAEHLLTASGAVIRHMGDRACYSPSLDEIRLPKLEQFATTEGYYSTALHELVHWTGHKDRLNRDFSGRFGSEAYAFEELVAEMGSAYLCGFIGLPPVIEHHASYLQSWLKALKEHPRALVEACSKASKAYEFVLNLAGELPQEEPAPLPAPKPEPTPQPEPEPQPAPVATPQPTGDDPRQALLDTLILYYISAPSLSPDAQPPIITISYRGTDFRIPHTEPTIAKLMTSLGFSAELQSLTTTRAA